MTMKYIDLNPTLYIQWIINIACKVLITDPKVLYIGR